MSDLYKKILAKSTTGTGTIPIEEIHIAPERAREDTPEVRRYIDEELIPSIVDNGLIHPPVLNFKDDLPEGKRCELVAGWCRTTAFQMLGLTEIPYTYRENMSNVEYREVELEENFRRKDMTWQEKVCAVADIHKLKAQKAGAEGTKWGQAHTGKLLGTSAGHINNCLKIAASIKSHDEEIKNAAGVQECLQIYLKRKDDKLASYIAEQAGVQTTKASPITGAGPIRGEAGINLSDVVDTASQTSSSVESVSTTSTIEYTQNTKFDLSKIIYNEDNRDWFSRQKPESVDLVYTDIPFGIDMDNLDFNASDLDRVAEAHDVEENIEQMPVFLDNAYNVLKDGKYCAFWYDLAHHEKLLNWGKDIGFSVQPYPLVWCKTHPCRNRAGNIWWTKAVEYVMVMRKGQATLRNPQTKNYYLADGSAERKMQRNPFSKPFEVSKQVIEPLGIPGDFMVDPYAGEGSLVRAGLNMGFQVVGIEKEKTHYDRMGEHVRNVLTAMTRGKAQFVSFDEEHAELNRKVQEADDAIKF